MKTRREFLKMLAALPLVGTAFKPWSHPGEPGVWSPGERINFDAGDVDIDDMPDQPITSDMIEAHHYAFYNEDFDVVSDSGVTVTLEDGYLTIRTPLPEEGRGIHYNTKITNEGYGNYSFDHYWEWVEVRLCGPRWFHGIDWGIGDEYTDSSASS
jgi:hypothetical protein